MLFIVTPNNNFYLKETCIKSKTGLQITAK